MWKEDKDGARIIPTMGRNNCGGRCIIRAHVKDGMITRITTETKKEAGDEIPLTACVRGLNYHKTFLGADRLLYPMRRTGERGEGCFERISWEEAVDIIAKEWIRIRDMYGPGSRYVNYATGVSALLRGNALAKRLLSLDGGYLDYYNSYSTACVTYTTPYLYGTDQTGSSYDTWLDSSFIVLWGHNPVETKFDAGSMHYLQKARDKGIPIVVIDPRENDTVKALGARWIPVRPATDAALMDAMAYVMVRDKLYDRAFIDRYCIGFDEEHMPPGVNPKLNYFAYLNGELDGIKKTPEWASRITGTPAEDIISLARAYAGAKPAALIPGYGVQRHGNGEQATRGAIMLACLTGNVGVSGGWAAGSGYWSRHPNVTMPAVENPYPCKIPVFVWTDAIVRGREMTPLDGVTGGGHLDSDIKMILNLAGNTLINQHSDTNKTAEILKDTEKCEFIVCSDLFMTPSARFADILLPGTSMFESENLAMPWEYGDFIGFHNKAIEPLGESRFEYDWLVEVADRLGLKEVFTQGHETVEGWLRERYEVLRRQKPELPEYEVLKELGIYRYQKKEPLVAFEKEIRDPGQYPFPTESGKIEIFSRRIYETEYRDYVPPIPCYVPAREGAEDAACQEYPLQLIGWHTKRRCHSIHDNNKEMHRIDPQHLWMHPEDAGRRGIQNEMMVLIWNDRGKIQVPVYVTERITPGVVALSQGAWLQTDQSGTDIGGSINVLTSQHPTPLAKGNPQHTNRVEVRSLI
ncbi:MAG: DMSO/selenate family reductase complex A subunit [Lachnospiraceae bacterium]